MAFLRVVKLEQRAGQNTLLKDISFQIEKGEVFVFIGPTGAGKTTLLRLINLLDSPYSGDIFLGDLNITGNGAAQLQIRRRMAMVFQKPVVFNSTVFENIAYPLKVRGMGGRSIAPVVSSLLDKVGLAGYAKRKARTLSGGEAQRVALARAMASQPEVLLLDEPTANLDPASVKMIEDLVLKFNRESGVTVVMATHDMQQGQRLADRVGVLMAGELVYVGKPSEVFLSPDNIRVADFVGIRNILHGKVDRSEAGIVIIKIINRGIEAVSDLPAGSDVDIYVRPEDIVLSSQPASGSARNSLDCVIKSIRIAGSLNYIELDCGFLLEALVTSRSAEEMKLEKGKTIYASFKATAVKVLPGAKKKA